jgi:hypothetical protein
MERKILAEQESAAKQQERPGQTENNRGNNEVANASEGFLPLDRNLTECHRRGAANCTIAIGRDLG